MRRGFTLIELLLAMAILAVISVMAVQALGGVFHQRAILTRTDERNTALVRALSLLRQDLEAAVPASGAGSDTMVAGFLVTAAQVSWQRAGFAEVPGGARGSVGGVIWTLVGGTLTRTVTRAAEDGGTVQQSAPVLPGVSAITLVPLGAVDAEDNHALAPGYEATLETENWGRLRLVVAR